MTRPAIFFDRDNTLILNDGFLGDPAKVVLIDGAAQAVVRARDMGFATVTVSNQSGVARGMFEEEDVQRVNARMDELLAAENPKAIIERHEYCPFHPEGVVDVYKRESDRRKPGAGMILSAAQKLEIDLARSWVVGDMPRDIQAGKAAGCKTVLLKLPGQAAGQEDASAQADFTVDSLQAAMDVIEKSLGGPSTAPSTEESKPQKPWLAAAQKAREQKAAQPAPAAAPAAPIAAPAPPVAPPPPALEPAAIPATSSPVISRPIPDAGDLTLEQLATMILEELRRRHEQDHADFSVTKLLAGIVQIMSLAAAFLSYMRPGNFLEVAIYLQALTIALLIMGRQH